MAHFKQFSYNFEYTSARDIVDIVKKNGLQVEYLGIQGFHILNSGIDIRHPFLSVQNNLSMHRYSGSVLFKMYDEIYYPQKNKFLEIDHTFGPRNDQLFAQHDKLFNQLKRKFQMGKDEISKAIKDMEWIKNLEKYGYEKAEELYAKNINSKKFLGIF